MSTYALKDDSNIKPIANENGSEIRAPKSRLAAISAIGATTSALNARVFEGSLTIA